MSFVVLTVGKQDLDLAVCNPPALKAAFNNFIWVTEQDAYALRFAVTPLSLENCTVGELADAYAVSLIILEVALVFLAIRVNDLTHTVFEPLAHSSIVYLTGDLFHILDCFIQKCMPDVWHSGFYGSSYTKHSCGLFKLLLLYMLLSQIADKLRIFLDHLLKLSL